MEKYFLLLTIGIACSISNKLNSQSNLLFYSGYDIAKTEIFINDDFPEKVNSELTKNVNFNRIKLGVGYENLKNETISVFYDLNLNFGLSKSLMYQGYDESKKILKDYKVKEKLSAGGFNVGINKYIIGDMETAGFALMLNGSVGFTLQIMSASFEEKSNFYRDLILESEFHDREYDNHQSDRKNISETYNGWNFMGGVSAQYMFSKEMYLFCGVKYNYIFSPDGHYFIKNTSSIGVDLGIKYILY